MKLIQSHKLLDVGLSKRERWNKTFVTFTGNETLSLEQICSTSKAF